MIRIARIRLNVADLSASTGFYVGALGFEHLGTAGNVARLRLGGRELELVAAPGRPYPRPAAANAPWSQHFAIAVTDMAAAYAHLSATPHQAISVGGPQLLPPSTGSVAAYKFRDPDGHPLELSYDPAKAWADGTPLFATIDHSAVTVGELDASIAFYTGLGFRIRERLLNTGPEQDRLDGLGGTSVEIVVLTTEGDGPHLELLHYLSPVPTALPMPPDDIDIAATVLVIGGGALLPGLRRDPDGHLSTGERLLGAVLAGGQSRRFGSDKAVAELDGRRLIDLAVEGLSRHVNTVVICGRDATGLLSLPDRPVAGLGPLGGLNAALRYALDNGFSGVLTTGCDMPEFPDEAARLLTLGTGAAVIARQRLAGYWPSTLADRLDDHLRTSEDRSMAAWARAAGARVVPFDAVMPNINTPLDLAALAARDDREW